MQVLSHREAPRGLDKFVFVRFALGFVKVVLFNLSLLIA